MIYDLVTWHKNDKHHQSSVSLENLDRRSPKPEQLGGGAGAGSSSGRTKSERGCRAEGKLLPSQAVWVDKTGRLTYWPVRNMAEPH